MCYTTDYATKAVGLLSANIVCLQKNNKKTVILSVLFVLDVDALK